MKMIGAPMTHVAHFAIELMFESDDGVLTTPEHPASDDGICNKSRVFGGGGLMS